MAAEVPGPAGRDLDGTRAPAQVQEAVTADVHRAAQLISTGLSSFEGFVQDGDDR